MDKGFATKIYKDYHDLIKLTVINTIHSSDPDDIAICVHDVIMAVVLNKKLDEHPNIRGWLVKTAKNVTCEFNRNKRKIMEDSVEWIEELAHSKGFTDSLFEKMELERLKEQNYVARIMESDLLNDGDVIFFNMLIGGLTDEQIGDILVLTKGAIAVRRSRLRMKVKKILSEM